MTQRGGTGYRRLLVDEMLGRLARWLRVLGYDAVWVPGLDDRDLLELAEREERLLLTRDTLIMERRAVRRERVRALFVYDDRLDDQLRQLRRDMGLSRVGEPRCLVCNGSLTQVDRGWAARRVPSYVAETQSLFRYCPACDRVVWPGTHWQAMLGVFRAAGIPYEPAAAGGGRVQTGSERPTALPAEDPSGSPG